jgi:TetR/AcrR family transcriptional regulator, tetracycline repressor protein
MSTSTTRPSASRQPVKRTRGGTQPLPLSRDGVLRAALPVLERDGVDGLTVRAVADELGISSPAVYHYFSGRDELIARLCEQVAAEVDVTIEPGIAWDDAIVQLLTNMDRTFARYPGVAQRVLTGRKPSPAADRLTSTVHELLVDGSFSPAEADRVLVALQHLFGGWLLGRPTGRNHSRPQPDALERSIRWLLAGAAATAGRQRE